MESEAPLAVTVLGTVDADLGAVYLYEHLVFDFTSRFVPADTAEAAALADAPITLGNLAVLRESSRQSLLNLRAPPDELLLDELRGLSERSTVVDATPEAAGRDLARLCALSRASGVHIVAATGVDESEASVAIARAGAEGEDEPTEALADRLVASLTVGDEVGGEAARVRAGVLTLGEIPLSPPTSRARSTPRARSPTCTRCCCCDEGRSPRSPTCTPCCCGRSPTCTSRRRGPRRCSTR